MSFETPETVPRLFRFLDPGPGDSLETLSGFRARRARQTPVRGGVGCKVCHNVQLLLFYSPGEYSASQNHYKPKSIRKRFIDVMVTYLLHYINCSEEFISVCSSFSDRENPFLGPTLHYALHYLNYLSSIFGSFPSWWKCLGQTSQKYPFNSKNAAKRHPPKRWELLMFWHFVFFGFLVFSVLDSRDLPLLLDILTL